MESGSSSKAFPQRVLSPDGKRGYDPKDLAGLILKEHFITNKILTLRFFRSNWFEWDGCQYFELPEDDLKSKLMGFLQDLPNIYSTTQCLNVTLANIKSQNFSFVPSNLNPPIQFEDEM